MIPPSFASGPLFSTPEEVARHAIDAGNGSFYYSHSFNRILIASFYRTRFSVFLLDVHVIGVSSQAAGHKTLIPALIQALKQLNGEHIKVIAGGVIPPKDYDALYKAGVLGIYGPGTKITDAALQVLKLISH
jgi:methylmalonyl-CoA mutase